MGEDFGRHFGFAAEFAAQRPFGTGTIAQDAAEHARSRGRACNLFGFFEGIDGEQAHTQRKRGFDVALFLDGGAVGDAVCRCAGGQRHADFLHGCAVKRRPHRCQQAKHLRLRVGLDGIIDPGVRHGLTIGIEIVAHDIEIDDEARAFRASVGQKITDALGRHGGVSRSRS